jgi:hypothetical protein
MNYTINPCAYHTLDYLWCDGSVWPSLINSRSPALRNLQNTTGNSLWKLSSQHLRHEDSLPRIVALAIGAVCNDLGTVSGYASVCCESASLVVP